jgi:putative beta-lysine N-acetyltransferase
MRDRLQTIGSSRIQHGKANDRIYLMQLAPTDLPELVGRLEDLAHGEGYGKIFAKVPASSLPFFQESGYHTEALVPGFFQGREFGHFMARYLDPARAAPREAAAIEGILARAEEKACASDNAGKPAGYRFRMCTPGDLEDMASLYREVFVSYPFPIQDPAYLCRTMEAHVFYFGAWQGQELAALGSAEQYPGEGHVEMTDFATRAAHRGRGLASGLLQFMEESLRERRIGLAYTIARALSMGMNTVFARAGYVFGGTLYNNTQISGRIESMNVWYKSLE